MLPEMRRDVEEFHIREEYKVAQPGKWLMLPGGLTGVEELEMSHAPEMLLALRVTLRPWPCRVHAKFEKGISGRRGFCVAVNIANPVET